MSTNLDTIRGGYEAFARQDIADVLSRFDDSISWESYSTGLPFSGEVFRGREGVGGFFSKLPELYEELRVLPEEFLETGDTVVVLGRHRARGAGGEAEAPFAHLWELRDGKVFRFREYVDSAALVQALGQG